MKISDIDKTIVLGPPCSQGISTSLKLIGTRNRYSINVNSGIGGSQLHLIGLRGKTKNEVELTESKRSMVINPLSLTTTETVKLYKQTHVHTNPNIKSPLITYLYTLGEMVLEQSTKEVESLDSYKKSMYGKVQKNYC